MGNNWNQLIERYLNNELSAEGKIAFETELAKNQELQDELELHQLTRELIRRNSLRTLVKQSGKWFHLKKTLIVGGVIVVSLAIIAAASYFVLQKGDALFEQSDTVEQSLFLKLEEQAAFDNLPSQYFKFTGESDVFLSETGVLLSLTEHSFLLNGQPYSGEAIVQWQEAQDPSDIVKAGLSSKSGDRLLETQGMFSLNAFTPDGKKLELSNEGAYVQVPVEEVKEGMKLFKGVPQSNGDVDWQNPVELERLPKPKNMQDMDLYPSGYEPKLNELKWHADKKKRDSLYLSFEEDQSNTYPQQTNSSYNAQIESKLKESNDPYNNVALNFYLEYLGNNEAYVVVNAKIQPGWYICPLYQAVEGIPFPSKLFIKEQPGIETIGKVIDNNPTITVQVPTYNSILGIEKNAVFKQKIRFDNNAKKVSTSFIYQRWNQSQVNQANTYVFLLEISQTDSIQNYNIPPSKVLGIWNSKFNNTNLATQEFEDRMKLIHETCNEQVFDIYANNLQESLWKLDEQVVALGYSQFQKFANQRIGKIKIDDAHQKNLTAFYDAAVKKLRKQSKENAVAALKKEQKWDQEMYEEREQMVLRKGMRESENLSEEFGFNLKNVYRQLGVSIGFGINQSTGSNIVNIDKYVMDATIARKSTVITDPITGKTAQITYESVTAEIPDYKKYDKLFMYLFSKEMNSYQRLDFNNGKLDYPLNGDMNYIAAIIGINENGYFYHEVSELKAENLGSVSLEQIDEREFDKRINRLNNNRVNKPMSLKEELQWLFKEKANYKVLQQRRKEAEFRMALRPVIFPCMGQSEADFIGIQPFPK